MADPLTDAFAKLEADDPQGAFMVLRPLLDFPASSDGPEYADALALLAQIARSIAGPTLAARIEAVLLAPNAAQVLYDAGFALYEEGLHRTAATLLVRANAITPGRPGIVTELSAALEGCFEYAAAARYIDQSGLAERDLLCAYLLGFNSLMIGDLETPRRQLPKLRHSTDRNIVAMRGALSGMLARADALTRDGIALDDRALGAWHAVLEGAVLLHESPHGHETPMHGRYAFVGDSPSLMREGLERLRDVLSACGIAVPRVVAAPDRASRILAIAAARALGVPFVPWSAAPVPGLVVAWSLDHVSDRAFLEAMREHAPSSPLFVHACAWVDPFPFAPDIVTLLHQKITHPWMGGALTIDPATGEVVPASSDPRSEEVLAEEILRAPITDPSVSRLESVMAIARAVATPASEDERGGLFRSRGKRIRQRAGSPVPSARFI